MAKRIIRDFDHDNHITKNKERYEEGEVAGKTLVVGKLYVTKEALAELGSPKKVRVTIEALDG